MESQVFMDENTASFVYTSLGLEPSFDSEDNTLCVNINKSRYSIVKFLNKTNKGFLFSVFKDGNYLTSFYKTYNKCALKTILKFN
jgi:hypothetical protein